MTQEINAIIEKNLPAQVEEILQKQLAQGEKDAKELESTVKALEAQRKQTDLLEAQVNEYHKLDVRNSALELREKEVAEKERLIELSTMKIQLEEANKRADIVINFTNGLVRNTSFRKTVFDNENQAPYMGANNQWISPTPVHKNLTETSQAD